MSVKTKLRNTGYPGMHPESAKELRQLDLWEEFCKEIDYRIECLYCKMDSADNDSLIIVQREISFWKNLKLLPDQVMDREG